jgi:hypothetical protein
VWYHGPGCESRPLGLDVDLCFGPIEGLSEVEADNTDDEDVLRTETVSAVVLEDEHEVGRMGEL